MSPATDPETQKILESLRRLEQRVARLEEHLDQVPLEQARSVRSAQLEEETPSATAPDAGLEQRIGEFGLAWVGSVIFLLGLVFLMAYAFNQGHHLLAALIGYAAALGLYWLARLWKAGYAHFSRVLLTIGMLLFWYTTLRLHFFTPSALVADRYVALTLLFLILALQFYVALAQSFELLAWPALVLSFASALLADATHVTLPLVAAISICAVVLARRRQWWAFLTAGVILTYLTHLVWLLSNPLMGHPLGAVSAHQNSLIYLFIYAAAYAWPAFGLRPDSEHLVARGSVLMLNCLGFSAVTALTALTFFQKNYAGICFSAAAFFLILAMLQWLRLHRPFVPSLHACFGYMALSIAIYGYAGIPAAFPWLSLQSLLVLSMALWFRSKILVVINFLIYLGILAVYWVISPQTNAVNFSFALVALASARVMNWQKTRLTLRTEVMRNLYLAIAFVLVLYSLYRALPASYVALSWTVAAVCYFVLSLLLRNIKYRWMAIFQLLATVLYLFFVDLARLDPRFRVVAFLFLGLMALGISLSYSKLRRLLGRNESHKEKDAV